MALNAPASVEVEQIQFKIHDKFQIFQSCNILRSNINLLATSSSNGLVFMGNPYKGELVVIQLKTLVETRDGDGKLYARIVQVPSKANCIATSCDGQHLAINYTLNNCGFLAIYNVLSFYEANIVQNFQIRISPDDNVEATQLLWNPIISNTIALIMNDGSVGMYNLKDNTYEFYSLDKSQQVFCGCWSPKGKQIVFGFRSGKIVQFKPDLKPARTIECPPSVVEGGFKTIAIQWLSTYQFAAAYLQDGDDMTANLFIVNAPKSGQSSYINYYDICYSTSGPRIPQVFFMYVQPWNMLLVANSNSMEIGILGTLENGEAPNWTEYNINDSCRLSLPMTKDKLETYPIGFCLETGSSHQLIIGENEIPIMPMIHILSTHGQLITFDFLNLYPNSIGICSPYSNIHEKSIQIYFKELVQETEENIKSQNTPDTANMTKSSNNFESSTQPPVVQSNFFTQSQTSSQTAFSLGGPSQSLFGNSLISNNGTSLFGTNPLKFGSGNVLGSLPQQTQQQTHQTNITSSITGNQIKTPVTFGNIKSSPAITNAENNAFVITSTSDQTLSTENPEKNKPLYTVQPVFVPSDSGKISENITESVKSQVGLVINDKVNIKDPINYDYIEEMIQTEIQCFELELRELSLKSKDVNISIGNMENIRNYTKKLEEFHEIVNKGKEWESDTDIQGLRNSINECFTMIAEVKSKLEFFENPQLSKIALIPSNDQASRRQLARLTSTLATNEAYLKIIKQKIDANWSDFQDVVYKNSNTKMHIPNLEGIYQTMTKQKNILAKERQKIAHLKSKLNFPGQQLKQISKKKTDINPDSLADSILSLNLSEHVSKENSKLNNEKLQSIRNALQNRKIINIKPQRPDRLQSEVILRSKIKTKKEMSHYEATFSNTVLQTSVAQKVETGETQNLVVPSKDIVITKVQQANVSQLNPQSHHIKTQLDQTPNSFNSPLISTKSMLSNISANSFGNVGLSLTKPISPVPENKNSPIISSLLLSKNQSTVSVNNNSNAVLGKPFGGTPGVFSCGASNNSVISFGNLSNTMAPSAAFGNITSKGSFTPVSAIQPFSTNTSDLTFNVKSTADSQNVVKTQAPNQQALASKSTLLFQHTTISDSSKSDNVPLFAPSSDSKKVLEPQTQSEKQLSTNSFLENLNICKPTAKTSTTAPNVNIFGGGVFTLSSQNNNSNVTMPETKTNFLNTFSSTSKSPIFGSAPIPFNTSSAQIPFVFAQSASTPVTSTDLSSNKSAITSITTTEMAKPVFSIGKSPSMLSFGASPTPIIPHVEAQTVIKNEQQVTNTPRTTSVEVTQTVESIQKTVPDSQISAVNLSLNTTTSKIPEIPMNAPATLESSESANTPSSFGSPNTTTISTVVLPSLVQTSTTCMTTANTLTTPASSTTFSFTFDSLDNLSGSSTTTINDQPVTIAPRGSITFGTAPPSAGTQITPNTSISSSNQNISSSSTISSGNALQTTGVTTTTISTGNIFGGIPKPDQSVFSQPSTFGNIFAQTAITPQFGHKTSAPTSVPSIFGGNSSLGGVQKTSAFGSSIPVQNSNSNFANSSEQKTDNTQSIFGSPSNAATNSGSIFSRSPFSLNSNSVDQENTTNIFGNSSPANMPFNSGSGGFIFGGGSPNSNQTSSTSPFASASFSTGASGTTTGFGAFGTNQSGMAFGQAVSSTSQTFGSPNTSLQKPTFGGPPTFGSPPSTFGNPPTFGGTPTFGSGIKGFGNFSTPTNLTQTGSIFGSPTQKSEYFEALGSSSDGLSFGNLAQNANANSAKPNFAAGSSFSSWR